MKLSIFDLDHTLLKVNSSFRFGIFLYHKKYFSFWKLFAGLVDYACHKWLGMPLLRLHQNAFKRLFQNQSYRDICSQVELFLDESFESMLYSPAVLRLKKAQKEGDQILILSSSPDFLVKAIADRFQVGEWKATVYQTDSNGKFKSIAQLLDGNDKARYVQEIAKEKDIPLSSTEIYSDSYLDWPMLKIAGKAVGVMPDRRLKEVCLKMGWEIL